MKLPSQFKSWVEFVKHAISHYPDSKIIDVYSDDNSEYIERPLSYNMHYIKSKACDEILSELRFTEKDVLKFKNVAMCTGYFTNDEDHKKLENMVNLLLKLC